MVTKTENDLIGAIGGGILAACLAPQLWRILRTRSARDLSYVFLVLFTVGLSLTAVYLINEGAVVGWACILVEIAFSLLMLAAKIYLEHCSRQTVDAKGGASLPTGLHIPAAVRFELHKFLEGGGGAALPLLKVSTGHVAAHLLLDCQLAPPTTPPGDVATATAGADTAEKGLAADLQGHTLEAFAELLQRALDAAGLPSAKRPFQTFPSFSRGRGGVDAAPSVAYLACKDGYVTSICCVQLGRLCMYRQASTSTLAVDFLGASEPTIAAMSRAARAFCRDLASLYPGSTMVASALGRLPMGYSSP